MELSNVDANALHIFLSVIQTINWLGGIWGLVMLAGMVGNTLDSTQVVFILLSIIFLSHLDLIHPVGRQTEVGRHPCPYHLGHCSSPQGTNNVAWFPDPV